MTRDQHSIGGILRAQADRVNAICLLVALSFLAVTRSVVAQVRQSPDSHALAHQALKVIYPSLLRRHLYFALRGDDARPFDGLPGLSLHPSVAIVDPGDAPVRPRHDVLTGFFDFDERGRLIRWFTTSEFVHAKRRSELRDELRDLDDSEVAERLKTLSLLFGPDSHESVLASIRPIVQRLEPLIGNGSAMAASFFPRYVEWVVSTHTTMDTKAFVYEVHVEPFSGRISAITSHDDR